MNVRFDGGVAVVTGAGSGIGFACAKELALSGAKVAMVGRNGEKIQKAAEMLAEFGQVKAYALDVADAEAIPGVVEQIRAELGEIDWLIQSAGIMAGGDALELSPEEWDRVMNVNARGLFFMMQAVVKQSMKPRGAGAIVNIASMAGVRGMVPPMCSAHYSAGKGAAVALTMQGAVEWGRSGIRVNAIAPGGTMSMGVGVSAPAAGPGPGGPPPEQGFCPTGKFNSVEDVAQAAAFLCSAMAGNITGQTLIVDGGVSIVGY